MKTTCRQQMLERKAMKKICRYLWDNFELLIMQICFWLLLICVCVNIILRWVFSSPLFYAEELSRIFFIWMCFWGFGYVQREESHIRLTVFAKRFPVAANFLIDMIVSGVGLFVFGWILVSGIRYLDYVSIRRSSALQIPMQYLTLILPLTSGVMMVRIIQTTVRRIQKVIAVRKNGGNAV
ncbi:TRAP transporter small permease [Oscillibacter sp.]|uniref:TRAP transporter small permease n=1 Tax=Oscillibacter sp. TaxID=1945593 RepID=UPI00216FCA24|nr:TRAP transporter small permease [Oscillibacter sp.]MCI9648123.1 TRAP transporter small permease [Oscillibacter sp.]